MAALSAAPLWEQQRSFFITEGPRVWRDSIVPSYVSTNPFLGGFLAEVLAAYIADVGTPIDVIELGGGSGQLAFHVLRQLRARLGDGGGVRYVLSDLAPSMLSYWRQHPRLRPFVEAGVLDFAEFDVSRPAPLQLTESGDVLGAAGAPPDRPVAVVASYCFDSVPQDLFAVDEDGRLFECVVPEPRPDSAGGGWPDTGGVIPPATVGAGGPIPPAAVAPATVVTAPGGDGAGCSSVARVLCRTTASRTSMRCCRRCCRRCYRSTGRSGGRRWCPFPTPPFGAWRFSRTATRADFWPWSVIAASPARTIPRC